MDARSHEVIAPLGQDVLLADGSTVTVRPIKVGQLPRFVKAVRPMFGALAALVPDPSSPGAGAQGADPGADPEAAQVDLSGVELDLAGFLDLYTDHAPAMVEAVCICTGLQAAQVEDLDLEQAFTLVMKVWEVNRDFFVNRVAPLLKR